MSIRNFFLKRTLCLTPPLVVVSRALTSLSNGLRLNNLRSTHTTFPSLKTTVSKSLNFGWPMGIGIIRHFASKRHKAVLRQTKGFRGRAKNCFTIAIKKLHKSWQYAYRDRKVQKREWRSLWITRLNAGVRQHNMSYCKLIPALAASNIHLNRKVLSELAAMEPFSFKAVLDVTKAMSQKKDVHKVAAMAVSSN